MRAVAMRPGRMMLAAMLSTATSRGRVFDQPTCDSLRALQRARLGIGDTTPEEVLVMIRPHRRWRMPGSIRSVSAITNRTIVLNCASQVSAATPEAKFGGGLP